MYLAEKNCDYCTSPAHTAYLNPDRSVLATTCVGHANKDLSELAAYMVRWSQDLTNAKTGNTYPEGYEITLQRVAD